MKNSALCLAFALICSVAFANNFTNTTNPHLCAQARANITQAEKAIDSQKSRMYPDAQEITKLEVTISLNRRIANQTCAPAQLCADAKEGLVKARKGLDAQKSRMYPNAQEIEKLNSDVTYFKNQINQNCASEEVCSSSRTEIQEARKKLANEKSRMYPDAKAIAALDADIEHSKRILAWRCSANETCAFSKAELKLARDALATEKSRMYPNADNIAKLEADAANSSELILSFCNHNETCAFIAEDIQVTEGQLRNEKSRLYPDRSVIARREAYLFRLKNVQADRCTNNSGFMRLAEVAVRGGRFLAKLLRH